MIKKLKESNSFDASFILNNSEKFRYQFLDRLKMDCNYFLGNGNGCTKYLWAQNVDDQIDLMMQVYDSLPVKPEWLTLEDIGRYAKEMKNFKPFPVDVNNTPIRERNLTKAERHNNMMDRIFQLKKDRDADMLAFIKAHSDLSDEELQKIADDDLVAFKLKELGLQYDYWQKDSALDEVDALVTESNNSNGSNPDLSLNVKDWYISAYPSDELGPELNDSVTFEDIYNTILAREDIYYILGEVSDTIIRERVFEKLSQLLGTSYGNIYDLWLSESVSNSDFLPYKQYRCSNCNYTFYADPDLFDGCCPKCHEHHGEVDIVEDETIAEAIDFDFIADNNEATALDKQFDSVWVKLPAGVKNQLNDAWNDVFHTLLHSRRDWLVYLNALVDADIITSEDLDILDKSNVANGWYTLDESCSIDDLTEAFKLGEHDIQNAKVYNRFNYTIQEVRIDNRNKTFERGNFSMGKPDKKFTNRQEYERFINQLKDNGYTEIESDYKSLKNKTNSIEEDTIKKKNGKWTNRGDDGKEHGEFRTKKAADAQRKAMYANGYKTENIDKTAILELNDNEYIFHEDTGNITVEKHSCFVNGISCNKNDYIDIKFIDDNNDKILKYKVVTVAPQTVELEYIDEELNEVLKMTD